MMGEVKLLLRMLWRATFWRCPHCGRRPIFLSVRQTRGIYDWFTPLDGCPRCGYGYEREPGYFLMAVWAINYGAVAVMGAGLYFALDFLTDWSLGRILFCVLPLAGLMGVVLVRHSKAWFIAFDQWCDPSPIRRGLSGGVSAWRRRS
jgi:uncharacterized protein (DUF983 family)